ncbi:clostripain-related cysteine peptidase [Geobacter sp.]|uniref:clostripain-related cysteine peptidase n=1 Tax=Geobacter sp. TaxID=46610 RepID=UPI0027BAADCB|nr:clostripain-related cysteine peptidase [Geobacter sp.]
MATKAPTKRNWTIMVYLAGDNNLDSAGMVDIKEMKTVGTTDQIAVLVQLDRAGANMQTVRYCLKKGTSLAKDAVQSLGETNMGDPKVLEDFVTWGATTYPADHYLLVLWNHGAGWDDANLYEGDVFSGAAPPVSRKAEPVVTRGAAPGAKAIPLAQARAGIRRTRRALFSTTVQAAVKERGIAFDDQAQDFLDNIELKKVMTAIKKKLTRKIDILGMDACLMSMAEVFYQMRDVADYSVGSEETEPGDGWPYDRILKALAAKPAMTPEELSKTIVTQYLASYKATENVTQSAVKLARLKPLATAIDGLAKALKGTLADAASRTALINARAQVQEYSRPYDDYCDLIDLCDLLVKGVANPAVKTACAAVKDAAAAAIVATGYKGPAVDNSRGISIYFPKRKLSPLYKTLDFTKKRAWDEFLKAYLAGLGR